MKKKIIVHNMSVTLYDAENEAAFFIKCMVQLRKRASNRLEFPEAAISFQAKIIERYMKNRFIGKDASFDEDIQKSLFLFHVN